MRNPARGFTMIEIMLVVVIIGIISSIAIPYYQKTSARAYRAEVLVVLNKIRQHFIGLYNDQNTFVSSPGGISMGVGSKSAWNPGGMPGPSGAWLNSAKGWVDMPFPPEGNIKLRYRYTVDAADQMTFYVCGIFPGFGPPDAYPCGADDGTTGAITGNYMYQESLKSTATDGVAGFPGP